MKSNRAGGNGTARASASGAGGLTRYSHQGQRSPGRFSQVLRKRTAVALSIAAEAIFAALNSLAQVRQEIEHRGDDNVDRHKLNSLKPIGLPVPADDCTDEDANEKRRRSRWNFHSAARRWARATAIADPLSAAPPTMAKNTIPMKICDMPRALPVPSANAHPRRQDRRAAQTNDG
jgi:hypothetical protein